MPYSLSYNSATLKQGPVAQLGARFNRTEEVGGSNPPRSTKTVEFSPLKPLGKAVFWFPVGFSLNACCKTGFLCPIIGKGLRLYAQELHLPGADRYGQVEERIQPPPDHTCRRGEVQNPPVRLLEAS